MTSKVIPYCNLKPPKYPRYVLVQMHENPLDASDLRAITITSELQHPGPGLPLRAGVCGLASTPKRTDRWPRTSFGSSRSKVFTVFSFPPLEKPSRLFLLLRKAGSRKDQSREEWNVQI
eukprot:3174207-Rhodomonas_salina.4